MDTKINFFFINWEKKFILRGRAGGVFGFQFFKLVLVFFVNKINEALNDLKEKYNNLKYNNLILSVLFFCVILIFILFFY